MYEIMCEDASNKALRQVEEITESEPIQGEDLLESPALKRKLVDARKALQSDLSTRDPSGEKLV